MLKDHSLRSGIWVGAAMDSSQPQDQQQDLKSHFTALTSENAFKWSSMETFQGQIDFTQTDQMVQFAQDNNFRIRAHTLFWHRMQNPSWVRDQIESAADHKTKLLELMDARISQVVGRYKGRVDIWDVVNEPLRIDGKGWDIKDGLLGSANFFYLAAGEQYIDYAFAKTRATDPRAKLFLNEYLSRPALNDFKSQSLLALLTRLKKRKVPIDGVGLQLHGFGSVKSPFFSNSSKELSDYMKAIAKLGLHVEITELDISLPAVIKDFAAPGASDQQHLKLQANLYGNAAKACAQTSACSGITVWGLRDKDSWLNSFVPGGPHRPLLLDDNGSPKPAYTALAAGLLQRCHGITLNAKLCSEPWPNPQNAGVPYPARTCNECVKPALKNNILKINSLAWKWQRPIQRYSYQWMQSTMSSNSSYVAIHYATNSALFKPSHRQHLRWVKVCVRAYNDYGWSAQVCSSPRGPFRS